MAFAIAPGKFILFGEHAVVYGEPAIAVAIDLTMRIDVDLARDFLIDGRPLDPKRHPYLHTAIGRVWRGKPISFEIRSGIPSASGLGSSAAITVATIAAVQRLKMDMLAKDKVKPEDLLMQAAGETPENLLVEERLAKTAFEVEYDVQGRASPTDTSTVTHGSSIMLAKEAHEGLLWRVDKGDRTWFVHHVKLPELTFVVGNTGIRGRTSVMVQKVKRYTERSGFARDIVSEIGAVTKDGLRALATGDKVAIGNLMAKDHKMLVSLGVSCKELDRLVKAASAHSFGAKLTGAGGGGCIIALTDNPQSASKAISEAGGTSYIVKVSKKGVTTEG